ncbi:fumarylacetoacetate hydrolase family protein [Caldiplasma sukawensis]
MRIGRGFYKNREIFFSYEYGNYFDITENVYLNGYYGITREFNDEIKIDGTLEKFLPPMPVVNQIRDCYAFEEHVRNSRKARGLDMDPTWYKFPVYYYTNKDKLLGNMEKLEYPYFTKCLDLEVEIGIIIGKNGSNIKKEEALKYIYGLTLMNDWSARDVWKDEAKLNLGPSKSKDFATSIGPYVTTVDTIMDLWNGKTFNINVESYINGKKFSSSNMESMYWSIGELIEYISMDSRILRGDVIMTGTLPGGCIFERNPNDEDYLKKGDVVRIKSNVLGELENEVI